MNITREDFVKYIKNNIGEEKYNKERKSQINFIITCEIICILCIVCCAYLKLDFFIIVLFPLMLIVPSWCNKNFKAKLKKTYRTYINRLYSKYNFNGEPLKKEVLEKSALFSVFKEAKYDDIIQGEYKDIKFTVAEINMNTKKNVVFRGVVIDIPFNKKNKGRTIVTSKQDENVKNRIVFDKYGIYLCSVFMLLFIFIIYSLFMYISKAKDIVDIVINLAMMIISVLSIFFLIFMLFYIKKKNDEIDKNLNEVILEDVEFGNKFNVYSNDQIEARYLVTPTFMERLKNIQTAFGSEKLKCSFFDDRIMFSISTKEDLFEIGDIYRPLGEDIEKFYDQIQSIHHIIDYFKLNEKTGL